VLVAFSLRRYRYVAHEVTAISTAILCFNYTFDVARTLLVDSDNDPTNATAVVGRVEDFCEPFKQSPRKEMDFWKSGSVGLARADPSTWVWAVSLDRAALRVIFGIRDAIPARGYD
jgi:hypothetical protein